MYRPLQWPSPGCGCLLGGGGGVCSGGVCPGVSAQERGISPGGCTPPGPETDIPLGPEANTPLGPEADTPCPVHAEIHTPYPVHAGIQPPMNRITDRCKNITFPQLLTVKITMFKLFQSTFACMQILSFHGRS